VGSTGAGAGTAVLSPPDPSTAMKRAISEGDIPAKEKEKEKEEEYAPLDINGLFERLAPSDGTLLLFFHFVNSILHY
jgi:hypothetical protein